MRVCVQRVAYAQVEVAQRIVARSERGLLVLAGFTATDTPQEIRTMAKKVANLRIFPDENGKMNRDLRQAGGSIVSVSQFTLYADCHKGNRPSFARAAEASFAEPLFSCFNEELRRWGCPVQTGIFGADMKVSLLNDGPVTLFLDSQEV